MNAISTGGQSVSFRREKTPPFQRPERGLRIPVDPVIPEIPVLPDETESGLFQNALASGVRPDGIGVQNGNIQFAENVADGQFLRLRSDSPILPPRVLQGNRERRAFPLLNIFDF